MLSLSATRLLDIASATRRGKTLHIEEESIWRHSVQLRQPGDAPAFAVGRWAQARDVPHELTAKPLEGHYTLDVLLKSTGVECYSNGRKITSGHVAFGATQVAAPGERVRCRFEQPVEAIHLFVAHPLVVSLYEDMTQSGCPADFRLRDPCFASDESIGRLAAALADTGSLQGPSAVLSADCLSLALLARVMAADVEAHGDVSPKQGLPSWRLRRAQEFIEANLALPITLHDIALHAGLSRMHFASLFKISTGMSPHTYLLHRRVQRAKCLLASTNQPVLDIAVDVGFHSQSHFANVFRKMMGATPSSWRSRTRSNLEQWASVDEAEPRK
jgi:AraC family transcriptional regulator